MQFQHPPLKLTVPGSNVKKYQLVYPIEGKKERGKKNHCTESNEPKATLHGASN